ncbi:MAG: asparagine synthase-related protein [Acidimicrobiia bacterium]
MAALDLTPLEVATSVILGPDPHASALPTVIPKTTPLTAMEAAVLPAVSRPPCIVTFSGGRDSSLVLAIAARVARREGLPAPVPATINFKGIETAQESAWQELVIRHLGLSEWLHRDITQDLDFVGPLATEVLRKHGILWPLNVYVHQALMRHATGGSLMTGMHGDAVFGGGRWLGVNQVLAGRRRPEMRDGLRVAFAVAPWWMRVGVFRHRAQQVPWLRPAVQKDFQSQVARAQAGEPRRWDRWIERYARRRAVSVTSRSMQALTGDVGALLVQPLVDPGVLASLQETGRARGIGDRTNLMRSLFDSVLPDALLARPDKAVFGPAFRGEPSKTFARDWQGDGVDTELVDPDVLKQQWQSVSMSFHSALLMQAAWLHVHRDT